MSSGNQRYINTAGTHNITMGDDFINVSTSVGAITLVFPNIRDSGAINLNKVWFVNDVDDMAATNNVTIVASATTPATELNGGSSVVLDTNGFSAEIVPSGYYNYMVNSGTSEGGMTGSGTLNYVAKFTPSGTVLGNSQLFDNGTGVGIGTTSVSANYFSVSGGNQPTAYFQSNASSVTGYALRLYADSPNTSQNVGLFVEASGGSQNYAIWVNEGLSGFGGTNNVSKVYIKGTDATSANYALKVDNSASSPLLYVRNDGNAYMGNNTFVSVVSPISLDLGGQYSNVNGANPKLVIYNNGIGRSGLGVSYNGVGQTELFFRADSNAYDFTWYHGSSTLARLSPNTFTLHRNEPNLTYGYAINFDLNNSVGSQKTYAVISGGIVDNTNGSEDGFLKFYTINAGVLSEKMEIKNTGTISMAGLQTGNAGLASGDLYVDTAANILANGDLVVGRKV